MDVIHAVYITFSTKVTNTDQDGPAPAEMELLGIGAPNRQENLHHKQKLLKELQPRCLHLSQVKKLQLKQLHLILVLPHCQTLLFHQHFQELPPFHNAYVYLTIFVLVRFLHYYYLMAAPQQSLRMSLGGSVQGLMNVCLSYHLVQQQVYPDLTKALVAFPLMERYGDSAQVLQCTEHGVAHYSLLLQTQLLQENQDVRLGLQRQHGVQSLVQIWTFYPLNTVQSKDANIRKLIKTITQKQLSLTECNLN
jgi:hypothetical protein